MRGKLGLRRPGLGWKAVVRRGYAVQMTIGNITPEQLEFIVIACVAECSGIPEDRLTADTDLTYNGIAGDDGFDIIKAIRTATGAKLANYDFYPHFGPEAAFSRHTPTSLTIRQLTAIVEADLRYQ